MVNRLLIGKRLDGSFGMDLSKPGFNVAGANALQLAFSSDYIAPVKVIEGTINQPPISGPAPLGSGGINGAIQTVQTIGFGRTVTPIPVLHAIAMAPAWNVPLAPNPIAQLGFLNNQWHSYVVETCAVGVNDSDYGVLIRRATGNASVTNEVDSTWASAKFFGQVYSDRVEFSTNCVYDILIKFLVLEA